MATISPNVPEEIANLMRQYKLTDEEHYEALQKIREYCFRGKIPSSKPKAFLVIAQTGGGKSNLTAEILRRNPNTVVIDSDAFKAFNPRKDEIIAKYPTIYGYLTGMDAYDHRDEIYNEALEKGYNILIEIAPSTKDKLFNVNFDELRQYGYAVEAAVLSVSRINSVVSIHERYEGQIEAGMASPKLTDLRRHEDSYNAVRMIVEELKQSDDVSKVYVFGRGDSETVTLTERGKVFAVPILYSEAKEEALETFDRVRKIDYQKASQTIASRIRNVERSMIERNAPQAQFDQFEQVKEIVLSNQNSCDNENICDR